MENIDAIATLAGSAVAILVSLSQVALWQRKEYRLDRLRSWLKSEESTQHFRPWLALSLAVATAWTLYLATGQLRLPNAIGAAGLTGLALYYLYHVKSRGIARPESTTKAMLILAASVLITIVYYEYLFVPGTLEILQWATINWALPIIIAVVTQAINVPTGARKRQIIRQAIAHRKAHSEIIAVGITGSFGKTSTKHFALQLIPESVGTKLHHNTPIGVAQDVLEQLTKKTKIYIAEIGAYRPGEIAEVAQIVQPDIGVITAVGNQHLALFGSQKNILRTKWELIDSLPPDGTVILNNDDKLLAQRKPRQRTMHYSQQQPTDVYANKITINPQNITCDLHIFQHMQRVTIPLAGEGALASVLAASAIAAALGIKPPDIFSRVEELKAFPKTMEIKRGIHGATIIDDGWTANEAGVTDALHHLERFPQSDKRVVLLPLIELGEEASPAHRRIGTLLAKTGAKVLLLNRAYYQDILTGMNTTDPKSRAAVVSEPTKLIAALSDLSSETVILLEGRVPDVIRDAITDV